MEVDNYQLILYQVHGYPGTVHCVCQRILSYTEININTGRVVANEKLYKLSALYCEKSHLRSSTRTSKFNHRGSLY